MIFLLHVEWPEMPPYKLLLTYYIWRMFEWHIPSCLEAISWASGVELNYTKKSNVFYNVYKRFSLLSRFYV